MEAPFSVKRAHSACEGNSSLPTSRTAAAAVLAARINGRRIFSSDMHGTHPCFPYDDWNTAAGPEFRGSLYNGAYAVRPFVCHSHWNGVCGAGAGVAGEPDHGQISRAS